MNEKIRVVCGECDKKLACPAGAAGKRVRCPACGAAIRVPGAAGSPEGGEGRKRRKRVQADDPYQTSVPGPPGDLPPRVKKKKASNSNKSGKAKSSDRHWSRRMDVGFGIMGASIVSNAVQIGIQGAPNMNTAAGKGQAFGQALVTIGGLIFGLILVVRGFRAKQADK